MLAGNFPALESSLHQLAPYIGKMRPTVAGKLVDEFTEKGDVILDPFAGSGTVALEAFIQGRSVTCADINSYAFVLTQAKLHPPRTLHDAVQRTTSAYGRIQFPKRLPRGTAPTWVARFFHPRTLAEAYTIAAKCLEHKDYFTLACLLGILHHQRPGFLSYPSNHLVPYLLSRKYPRDRFQHMYSYRPVLPRLVSKIERSYRRIPRLDFKVPRSCVNTDGLGLPISDGSVDAIITSPPYMDNLDYVRDNRLRLWFLGSGGNLFVSQRNATLDEFSEFLTRTFVYANRVLKQGGYFILVLGNVKKHSRRYYIGQLAKSIAVSRLHLFGFAGQIRYPIPEKRRSRPHLRGTTSETILMLRKGRT